ncbi:MAG: hypothetical protein HYX28_09280 [Candidatus Koribacter versatilis]|uniref:Transmembrane protein n=1 Tax=Candidatus Korobacter versatilis TaxID=658062 RepID=A0A932AA97_9BACT|nr:hypothetical protein [Candidatus Koribacter versatilis]
MVPRSVRIAAWLLSAYAASLLLEAFWISVAVRWSGAARAWNAIHPPGSALKQTVAALIALAIIGALLRGHRCAWFVALSWTTLLVALGGVLLGLALLRGTLAQQFVSAHPLEELVGTVSWICLLGAMSCLWRSDARAYFRH